jgi:hypothetical protein
MPAVEPVTSAVFPERSIFMCHLHPKRFRAKHALGLDPGVGTGSREENASKPNDADGDIGFGGGGRNLVIARSEATKQSRATHKTLDCFASLAMTGKQKRRPEAPL